MGVQHEGRVRIVLAREGDSDARVVCARPSGRGDGAKECWVSEGAVIAALFVDCRGPYWNRPDVDAWDVERDARKYDGPHPVVAHPPCERWGRYWSGGPSARVRRVLGDDDGCFASALASVRHCGGVLEHPEASHAFKRFGLRVPAKSGGWEFAGVEEFASILSLGSWTCCVEQGHYGHPARKATWLYYVGDSPPPDLIWGKSSGVRLDEGFHSKAERDAARAAGQKPVKRLSTVQNIVTPRAFAELLIGIAKSARGQERAA